MNETKRTLVALTTHQRTLVCGGEEEDEEDRRLAVGGGGWRVLASAAIIEELDIIQAMIEADEQLAARLQAEEQEQFSIKEKSRMLVEMIAERKKFFAAQRAVEQRKVVKSSETRTEGSYKRVGDALESDKSKKQKIDEHEAKKDDDQEEARMKWHIVIVKMMRIDKDGRMGYFKLIRDDGSSKRYSSMIKMLQDIDREDLETLWKLVKAKYGNTRPEEDYERVLWGDLKVMFELDIKSEIWRNLQGYKVTIWKLFDTHGVHFVRKRVNEVFKCILLVMVRLLMKLEDSEDEHQV
ncbi:hypothetical protein Tco_1121378 [Tanacetum coccineum]|uniref:Uncharacterized protein n=1 Tax=Tanacetum coccineum TaxID=301880 RepID=A0ABQ5J058_9ASTR